ncbi:hypothetical protein [Pantoea stewartii]|nr:hypothetical protein [Pantoea stewartii]
MQAAPDLLTPLNGIISPSEKESKQPVSKLRACSSTSKNNVTDYRQTWGGWQESKPLESGNSSCNGG